MTDLVVRILLEIDGSRPSASFPLDCPGLLMVVFTLVKYLHSDGNLHVQNSS